MPFLQSNEILRGDIDRELSRLWGFIPYRIRVDSASIKRNTTKLNVECLNCNEKFERTFLELEAMRRNEKYFCPYCKSSIDPTFTETGVNSGIETNPQYIMELDQEYSILEVIREHYGYEPYEYVSHNAGKNVRLRHKECGTVFSATLTQILEFRSLPDLVTGELTDYTYCPKCNNMLIDEKVNWIGLKFVERLVTYFQRANEKLHDGEPEIECPYVFDDTDIARYKDMEVKMLVKCKYCGTKFASLPIDLLDPYYKSHCPVCHGEKPKEDPVERDVQEAEQELKKQQLLEAGKENADPEPVRTDNENQTPPQAAEYREGSDEISEAVQSFEEELGANAEGEQVSGTPGDTVVATDSGIVPDNNTEDSIDEPSPSGNDTVPESQYDTGTSEVEDNNYVERDRSSGDSAVFNGGEYEESGTVEESLEEPGYETGDGPGWGETQNEGNLFEDETSCEESLIEYDDQPQILMDESGYPLEYTPTIAENTTADFADPPIADEAAYEEMTSQTGELEEGIIDFESTGEIMNELGVIPEESLGAFIKENAGENSEESFYDGPGALDIVDDEPEDETLDTRQEIETEYIPEGAACVEPVYPEHNTEPVVSPSTVVMSGPPKRKMLTPLPSNYFGGAPVETRAEPAAQQEISNERLEHQHLVTNERGYTPSNVELSGRQPENQQYIINVDKPQGYREPQNYRAECASSFNDIFDSFDL
jgi:Zn finger protein HypA/HybF involved in hydrogenase expression